VTNDFVAIFGTFGRYITHLRGTFVKNVKKSQKSTHPNAPKLQQKFLKPI
jgi:hypothetical protein